MTVPDVEGQPVLEAFTTLAGAGLQPVITEIVDESLGCDECVVAAQPAASRLVAAGRIVRLQVNHIEFCALHQNRC